MAKQSDSSSKFGIGINEDITVGELKYHLQTEDLGSELHKIRTTVFLGGTSHKVYEADYSSLLTSPNRAKAVARTVKGLHAKVIRRLRGGDSAESIPPRIEVRSQAGDSDRVAPSPPKTRGQIWDDITQSRRFALQSCVWDSMVERLRKPAPKSVESAPDELADLGEPTEEQGGKGHATNS